MDSERRFILTEAVAMLPLVRRILTDVRESRCRLCRLRRQLERADHPGSEQVRMKDLARHWQVRLDDCLSEAGVLGIRITPGVRCEAHFPFDHQWIGPASDGKIRPACFVYRDAEPTIGEWIFDGWPSGRRRIWPDWWRVYRPGQPRLETSQKH